VTVLLCVCVHVLLLLLLLLLLCVCASDVESAAWCEHQKHVFVLSLSGKPVYSR